MKRKKQRRIVLFAVNKSRFFPQKNIRERERERHFERSVPLFSCSLHKNTHTQSRKRKRNRVDHHLLFFAYSVRDTIHRSKVKIVSAWICSFPSLLRAFLPSSKECGSTIPIRAKVSLFFIFHKPYKLSDI